MLDEGDIAPDVTLHTPEGGRIRLSEMLGHPLVLFFYPKDDTSGCTTEAKDFSALKAAFDMEGVSIIGVSKGTSEGKSKFIAKHDLRVSLATDLDDTVCEVFGVWMEKSMYGKKYMGIDRSTFLLDTDRRIVRAWRKVKVPGHADEVLAAATALKNTREQAAF